MLSVADAVLTSLTGRGRCNQHLIQAGQEEHDDRHTPYSASHSNHAGRRWKSHLIVGVMAISSTDSDTAVLVLLTEGSGLILLGLVAPLLNSPHS